MSEELPEPKIGASFTIFSSADGEVASGGGEWPNLQTFMDEIKAEIDYHLPNLLAKNINRTIIIYIDTELGNSPHVPYEQVLNEGTMDRAAQRQIKKKYLPRLSPDPLVAPL